LESWFTYNLESLVMSGTMDRFRDRSNDNVVKQLFASAGHGSYRLLIPLAGEFLLNYLPDVQTCQ
jgi:hypothetical protein